jgi:hypothetical protein
MLACTLIVFIFSALCAASKGPGVQGTVNALIAYRFFIGEPFASDLRTDLSMVSCMGLS